VLAISSLLAARIQMAVSLGFHIIFASLGVGLPLFLLFAEWRALRTGDPVWRALARRWSKAFGILFAVGAVSGTVLSFALGLFWPKLMGRFGGVMGLPFALEAFAFFIEAIFLGIYLYGWDRLSPRAHLLSGVPVALSGAASAWFVVTANAWMNTPTGFRLAADGRVIQVNPIDAMLNPGTPVQTTHMMIAAYMATGFAIASVYAVGMLRGKRDAYHKRALAVGLALGAVLAPAQIVVGDWAARFVAQHQPIKLAALEGQWDTKAGAPLRIGGIPFPGQERTRFAIEIPKGLSWLAYGNTNAVVKGLKDVPVDLRPNTVPIHFAFQIMVASGFGMLGLGIWFGGVWIRKKALPESRWFLRAAMIGGPAAFLAIECGWMVTEIGRQPWIVTDVMRTADAVTTRPVGWELVATVATYILLGIACTWLLLRLAREPKGEPA
jgi:cytochrome bd ubiquinol oxidase subunit I